MILGRYNEHFATIDEYEHSQQPATETKANHKTNPGLLDEVIYSSMVT